MFCDKCGKPLEEGQSRCPECVAAELQREVQEEVQPEVQAVDTFELNQPEQKPAKKKGKKLPLILGAVAAVAIAAAVLVWGFFISGAFLPADSYMMKVEKKAVSESVQVIGDVYGSMLTGSAAERTSNGVKLDTHILFGDKVVSAAEAAAAMEGVDMDLSWLSDIAINMNAVTEGNMTQMDMGIGLDTAQLLTLSVLMNMQDMDMYMGVPEMNDTFIHFDMAEITGEDIYTGVDYDAMMAQMEQMRDVLPSQEAVEALLEKYIMLAMEQLDDVEKTSETVEVGDVKQKLTVITVKLSQKDVLKIAEAVLEEAKDDKEIKKIIKDIAEYMQESNPSSDPDDVYDAYVESVEELLDSLDYAKDEASGGTMLVLETYVNNSAEVVGRTIKVKEANVEISYITVWQGKNFAFEANMADMVELTGEGTKKSGIIQAEYELSVQGQDLLTATISDYDEKKNEEGYANFTLLVKPDEDLLEEVLDLDNSVLALLGDDLGLELKLTSSAETADMSLKLLADKDMLIGVTMSAEMYSGSVEMPDKTIEATDELALQRWMEGMDLSGIIDKLKDAGVPSMITDALEAYIGATPVAN